MTVSYISFLSFETFREQSFLPFPENISTSITFSYFDVLVVK